MYATKVVGANSAVLTFILSPPGLNLNPDGFAGDMLSTNAPFRSYTTIYDPVTSFITVNI